MQQDEIILWWVISLQQMGVGATSVAFPPPYSWDYVGLCYMTQGLLANVTIFCCTQQAWDTFTHQFWSKTICADNPAGVQIQRLCWLDSCDLFYPVRGLQKNMIRWMKCARNNPGFLFQIYLRFLEYQMENSNECKKNFVAVYDGSSAIEDLKVMTLNNIVTKWLMN